MHPFASTVATGLRDVARLVVPVQCPGCGQLDQVLCRECVDVLAPAPTRCERDVPRLDRMDGYPAMPVWRLARYAGRARGIVLAWKDQGRADLTPARVAAARGAGTALAPVLATAAEGQVIRVVPVPSTPGARRRRGADLVRLLATAVVGGLTEAGTTAELSPVLATRRMRRDQAGLGARARGRNATVRVRRRATGDDPGAVGQVHLLVDDVVTTGSTLAACEEVLGRTGALVLGAFVLAATPPPARDRCHLLSGPTED